MPGLGASLGRLGLGSVYIDCLIIMISGADFIEDSFTVTIPAPEETYLASYASYNFPLIQNNVIIDDDINENTQEFALIAQLGDDVSDMFACFKTHFGSTECFGRAGAGTIKIFRNDGKYVIVL